MKNRKIIPSRCAFTLIEILVVVVILGILASIVIPQFGNASADSIEVSVKSNLRHVRTQIELYRATHSGTAPTTIDDLVSEGYMHSVPKHPGEHDFEYNATTGVYTTTLDLNW